MKEAFRKLASASMALVVLFSTMSFSVDMHFCGDSLVDFSLFQKAEGCGMEEAQVADSCKLAISKEPCCSDERIVKEASNDLQTAFDKLTFGQQTFVATFFYTYINFFEGFDENVVPFKDYHPPFLEQDALVLNQVFLL